MLQLELSGQDYNKAQHRRDLQPHLNRRSESSIERKHQNISAALIEMGMPYIDGYKPLRNYQRILPAAIAEHLAANKQLQEILEGDADRSVAIPTVEDFLALLAEPPGHREAQMGAVAEHRPSPATGVNYLEREARNQALGDAGEQFVVNFERARLLQAGRDNLADQIERVSVTQGPAAGFDILSFEESGSDRYIEAKTTKYGKETPFFVTRNELQFSDHERDRYHLYRVFQFRERPRLYTLRGYLRDACVIEPTQFVATPA